MKTQDLSIFEYTYELPAERIAAYPLTERDNSKLLIWRSGNIQEDRYFNIAGHIPRNSILVFNDSKVIRARIRFQKSTGGVIEIFCLEPYGEDHEYTRVMSSSGPVRWKCMIGGAAKWKDGDLQKELSMPDTRISFHAKLVERLPDAYVVELSWSDPQYCFADVISIAGDVPLPPYIKRAAEQNDITRYQTIYAKEEGSVAAPTAGLHFTDRIMNALAEKDIQKEFVTLHVGAGTFKPVKAQQMSGHEMHSEWISVTRASIGNIHSFIRDRNGASRLCAVGTTAMRTLETLYWLGVKALQGMRDEEPTLGQWEVYEPCLADIHADPASAIQGLLNWMDERKMSSLLASTQLLIAPGYKFRIADALITNFHQPQSTLLLLVAAATGKEWKQIYQHALTHDYRFLSYGDGCLLFIDQ